MNEEKKWKYERFDCLPSTQEYAKEKRSEGENLLVSAKWQTGGKGTKGRSFSSERGGVYLSRLTFYEKGEFLSKDAFLVMAGAASAVCEVLCAYGLQPVIKWANDIHVNGKKICGILTENVFSGKYIRSTLVGVGLNVNNLLPAELEGIATTMAKVAGKEFSVDEVEGRLVEALCKKRGIEEYLRFVGYMGSEVDLLIGDERISAILRSVDELGNLIEEIDGEERVLTSAEVSVRLKN